MSEKSELELLAAISDKLDILIGVMAIQSRAQDDQIRVLYKLGFDSSRIGPLVGMSPGAVRQRKRKLKLQGGK